MTQSVLSPTEYTERVELILALLEERGYTTSELAALTGTTNGAIASLMKKLTREQQVHRAPDFTWRLGATPAPDATRRQKLDPAARVAQGSSSGELSDEEFAEDLQLHRQRKLVVKGDGVESWWLRGAAPDAPREVFTADAVKRNEDMLATKDASWRSPKPPYPQTIRLH